MGGGGDGYAVTEKNLGYFIYDLSLFGLGVALLDLTFFPMDGIFIAATIPIIYALRNRLGKMYIIPPKMQGGWKRDD